MSEHTHTIHVHVQDHRNKRKLFLVVFAKNA